MKLFNRVRQFITDYKAEVLFIWIIVICTIPNVALSITENLLPAERLTNVILPLGIYILLMATTRNSGKSGCWMFIMMFFGAFQIVLLYLFGRSVIAVDMFLNLVTTNATEVGELLGNMLPIILVVVIIYIPALSAAIYGLIKHFTLRRTFIAGAVKTSAGLISAGILSIAATIATNGSYSPLDSLYPLNVLNNIYLAIERTAKTADYHNSSEHFHFNARTTHLDVEQKEIYVAVIGETSRAPQWHLMGYDINTTAPLDSCRNLIAYPHAVSESNTTHKSVPMLMSPLDAKTFGDSIYTHKSFITAFKEAGFSTTFLSNQARNHSFIDFFANEADKTIFINDDNSSTTHKFDHDLLNALNSEISANTSARQLYVLHCYGSHFSYTDRYPSGFGSFKPDFPVDVSGSNNERLINAYNNTIEYTAAVLADLIKSLEAQKCLAALIYTSDHGEDIFDDSRKLFLHASPIPSYYQLHVPFLIWLSDKYREAYPGVYPALETNSSKFVSSSSAYFHTLIQISGLTSPRLKSSASLADTHYTPSRPLYLNDHNEGIPLEACGLQDEDFARFKAMGVNLNR